MSQINLRPQLAKKTMNPVPLALAQAIRATPFRMLPNGNLGAIIPPPPSPLLHQVPAQQPIPKPIQPRSTSPDDIASSTFTEYLSSGTSDRSPPTRKRKHCSTALKRKFSIKKFNLKISSESETAPHIVLHF